MGVGGDVSLARQGEERVIRSKLGGVSGERRIPTLKSVPASTSLSVWVKVDAALTLLEPESRFVLSPWDDLEPY